MNPSTQNYSMKRSLMMMTNKTQIKITEARPIMGKCKTGRQNYIVNGDNNCIVINKNSGEKINSSDEMAALLILAQVGSFV